MWSGTAARHGLSCAGTASVPGWARGPGTPCGLTRFGLGLATSSRYVSGSAPAASWQEPVEQHAAGLRPATVEAEAEFVQIGLDVLGPDGALMSAHQPSLQQRRDPVHGGKQLVRLVPGAGDRMPFVDEPALAGASVRGPAVRDHCGAGLDGANEERPKRLGLRVRDHGHPGAPVAARLT